MGEKYYGLMSGLHLSALLENNIMSRPPKDIRQIKLRLLPYYQLNRLLTLLIRYNKLYYYFVITHPIKIALILSLETV